MSLFNEDITEGFKLSSGVQSRYKIDCDYLQDRDIQAIAIRFTEILPPFGFVEGVPQGGLRLQWELEAYETEDCPTLLIVDDVLTTGASMEKLRGGREAIGAVIFARGDWCPEWITPLCTVNM